MELRIKELLKQKGITQRAVAEEWGITEQSVGQMIKHPNPTLATLEKWANVIGVQVWELFPTAPRSSAQTSTEDNSISAFTCPKCGAGFSVRMEK